MISSAVMIPDQPSPSHSPPPAEEQRQQHSPSPSSQPQSLKRRLSSPDTNSSKRARHESPRSPSNNAMSPPPHNRTQAQHTGPSQRKPSLSSGLASEEKKRGQRLFGALLGTLAPPRTSNGVRPSGRTTSTKEGGDRGSPTALAARRSEIEKRTQDRLRREREDREEEVRRRREEIDRVRRIEQQSWDEEGREVGWRNMRAMAGFLHTKTLPVLYYKPWELRAEEEARIAAQIREVDDTISRERDDWRRRKENEQEETQPTGKGNVQMDLDDQINNHDPQSTGQTHPNNRPRSRSRSAENRSTTVADFDTVDSEARTKQDISMNNSTNGTAHNPKITDGQNNELSTAITNGTKSDDRHSQSSSSGDHDQNNSNGTTAATAATVTTAADHIQAENRAPTSASPPTPEAEKGTTRNADIEGSHHSNHNNHHRQHNHHGSHHRQNQSLDSTTTNHNDEELVEGQEDDVIY